MKKANGMFIGLIFIVVGLLYACSALDIFDFSIFFPGWWTLFIIVPCVYALTRKNEDKTGPVIGLIIGICFLINAQNFRFHIDFWPMAVAVLCILIGWKMIFPGKRKPQDRVEFMYESTLNGQNGSSGSADAAGSTFTETGAENSIHETDAGTQWQWNTKREKNSYSNNGGFVNVSAVLGGKDVRVENECFTGADIDVIMGAIELNLRNAIISEDVIVSINAIMGGIDIMVPANVRVVTDGCSTIMGGIDVSTPYVNYHGADTPRLFITGNCIMGGIDIR